MSNKSNNIINFKCRGNGCSKNIQLLREFLEKVYLFTNKANIRLNISELESKHFYNLGNVAVSLIGNLIEEDEQQIKNNIVYSLLYIIKKNVEKCIEGDEDKKLIAEADNYILSISEYFYTKAYENIELDNKNKIAALKWDGLYGLKILELFYYAYINNTLNVLYNFIQKVNDDIIRIDILHAYMRFISMNYINRFKTKEDYYSFIDKLIINNQYYLAIYDNRSYDYLAEMYNKCPDFFDKEDDIVLLLKSQIMDNFSVDELLQLNDIDLSFINAVNESQEKCRLLFSKYKQLKSFGFSSEVIIKIIKYYPNFIYNIFEKNEKNVIMKEKVNHK